MESNKDEALRCLQVANECYQEGEMEKAIRLVNKSLRLFPTPQAQKFLERIENEKRKQEEGERGRERERATSPKKSHPSSSSTSTSSSSSSSHSHPHSHTSREREREKEGKKSYTEEQRKEVERIIKNKSDFYLLFQVEREATDAEIKKKYKKLCLLLHPDKNDHPKAEEAFKIISNAFSVLSDTNKRQLYDLHGENFNQPQMEHPFARSANGFYFNQEISPEFFFHIFNQAQQARFHQRRGGRRSQFNFDDDDQHQHQHQQQPHQQHHNTNTNSTVYTCINLFPFLLLFLLYIMAGVFEQESPFSFTQTQKYSEKRETKKYEIEYFVQKDFGSRFGVKQIKQLEFDIARVWLENQCRKQQKERNTLYYHAQNSWSAKERQEFIQKAKEFRLTSCEDYHQHMRSSP